MKQSCLDVLLFLHINAPLSPLCSPWTTRRRTATDSQCLWQRTSWNSPDCSKTQMSKTKRRFSSLWRMSTSRRSSVSQSITSAFWRKRFRMSSERLSRPGIQIETITLSGTPYNRHKSQQQFIEELMNSFIHSFIHWCPAPLPVILNLFFQMKPGAILIVSCPLLMAAFPQSQPSPRP